MFKWGEPDYLKFLILPLGMVPLYFWLNYQRALKVSLIFGKKLGFLTQSVSKGRKNLHFMLQVLATVLFILALARPQMGSRTVEIKQTGIELIFAVDVSNSMLAEDEKPSRLESAKRKIDFLLEQLHGDRVGLIGFAGSAHLISPLTSDYSALRMYISSLSPYSVSTQGTSFRKVIDQAISGFERGGVEGQGGTKPTRAILFFTDGEDNEKGVDAAIRRAKDQGIRLFAMGFGTAKGAPIPIRDDRGNLTGFKKDSSGQTVMSTQSDQALGRFATEGGGSYYHSTATNDDVRAIVRDLAQLQKAEFNSKSNVEYDEKYQIPLALGLFLALIDMVFGDRKRFQRRSWQGRFEVSR